MAFDYTTFSETDATDNRLTATAATLTITDLDTDEDVYCNLDLGSFEVAGYKFDFHFNISNATDGSSCYVWGLSSIFSNNLHFSTNADAHTARVLNSAGSCSLVISEFNNGSETSQSVSIATATDYYVTVERDKNVGSYGQLTMSVYSDQNRTTHVSGSPKTITLTENINFRHLYGMSSYKSGDSGTAISLIVSGLSYTAYSSTSISAIIQDVFSSSLSVDSILYVDQSSSIGVDYVL